MHNQTNSKESPKTRNRDSFRIADGFRTDTLPALVSLARSLKSLSPVLNDFLTLHLVLDANKVQGELRWRLGSRQKPFARTGLYEAIVAGVLVAYVPTQLEDEILEHIEDIARDTNRNIDEVHSEWEDFRSYLHVYAATAEPLLTTKYTDPDDLPYKWACNQLGLQAVYTDDPHLGWIGAPVVAVKIDGHLRDYARASTVKIGISIGSRAAVAVSIEMLPVLYQCLKAAMSWFKRQSPALQLALVGAAVALAVHPKSRAKFSSIWQAVAPIVGDALKATAVQLLTEFDEASQRSEHHLREIEMHLPPERKRTVLMRARAVCTVAKRPLTTKQIAERMRADGYGFQSIHLPTYLRRVLRAASEFSEGPAGEWKMIACAANQSPAGS